MTYKCKHDGFPTPAAELCLLLCFVLAFVTGTKLDGSAKWILNGVAVAFCLAAMNIANRFILSTYIYVLDRDFLKIYCVRGKNSVLTANIGYGECLALSKKDKTLEKSIGRLARSYSYTQNLFAKNMRTLYFADGENRFSVALEASDEFYDVLLSQIPAKNI